MAMYIRRHSKRQIINCAMFCRYDKTLFFAYGSSEALLDNVDENIATGDTISEDFEHSADHISEYSHIFRHNNTKYLKQSVPFLVVLFPAIVSFFTDNVLSLASITGRSSSIFFHF